MEKDLTGDTAKDATTSCDYGKADGTQPRTLTKVTKEYVPPDGAEVTAVAERLYELTGETKVVTSVENGDQQVLSWTYDGKVDRISGAGSRGKTAYVGLADKCIDLSRGVPGSPVQLVSCNGTIAQKWTFASAPGQADADLGTLSIYDGCASSLPPMQPGQPWPHRSVPGRPISTHTGFLGAQRDDASGYTPLGARPYDPVVGRFLSADPVLDIADPMQSNG